MPLFKVRGKQDKFRVDVRDFAGLDLTGSNDVSGLVNTAIQQASVVEGEVYHPKGTYGLASSLVRYPGVDIVGENSANTLFQWSVNSNGTILDIRNLSLEGMVIKDLRFGKSPAVTSATVTGIQGGSELTPHTDPTTGFLHGYNSAIATFENLTFIGLGYAIRGDAFPTGVGIFDCRFENIFIHGNGTGGTIRGLWLCGSGNTVVHPRLVQCQTGICLDYLNGESFDGMHILGGTFVLNGWDIVAQNANGIRPTTINGAWFEQSSGGIFKAQSAYTKMRSLKFDGCMLHTSSTSKMLDFGNCTGVISIDTCTAQKVSAGECQDITKPSSASGYCQIRNTVKYSESGVQTYINEI